MLEIRYGKYLFPRCAVIFSRQEKGGGRVIRNPEVRYHHAVSPDEHGYIRSFHDNRGDFDHKLAGVSPASGEIVAQIDRQEVHKKNPFAHISSLQRSINTRDISRGNDIAPQDSRMGPQSPRFGAGDLLHSNRTRSSVVLPGPDNLKMKWWVVGDSRRQHGCGPGSRRQDHGFSNNEVTASKYSDIIVIDPETREYRAIVDG